VLCSVTKMRFFAVAQNDMRAPSGSITHHMCHAEPLRSLPCAPTSG
jgi:hypothetical protein